MFWTLPGATDSMPFYWGPGGSPSVGHLSWGLAAVTSGCATLILQSYSSEHPQVHFSYHVHVAVPCYVHVHAMLCSCYALKHEHVDHHPCVARVHADTGKAMLPSASPMPRANEMLSLPGGAPLLAASGPWMSRVPCATMREIGTSEWQKGSAPCIWYRRSEHHLRLSALRTQLHSS